MLDRRASRDERIGGELDARSDCRLHYRPRLGLSGRLALNLYWQKGTCGMGRSGHSGRPLYFAKANPGPPISKVPGSRRSLPFARGASSPII